MTGTAALVVAIEVEEGFADSDEVVRLDANESKSGFDDLVRMSNHGPVETRQQRGKIGLDHRNGALNVTISPLPNLAKWMCRTHRWEMKQLTEHRNCVKSFVIIFTLVASVAAGHAQNAPWCLQSDAFDGD